MDSERPINAGAQCPVCTATYAIWPLVNKMVCHCAEYPWFPAPAALTTPTRDGEVGREPWQPLDSKPDDRPVLVGAWVEEDDMPDRFSVWTAYPGEPLGTDGTWGDPPTLWHEMPADPPRAALATQADA